MEEVVKGKGKKNLIIKTWERCKSIGRTSPGSPDRVLTKKSKSWHGSLGSPDQKDDVKRSRKGRVAPEGCFSVYVGPQKQRFVIKTEYANHPLFKMLLEEAESEYGFNSEGPLALPCNVDFFYKVLVEMDSDEYENIRQGCSFPAKSYRLLSPSRMVAINQF